MFGGDFLLEFFRGLRVILLIGDRPPREMSKDEIKKIVAVAGMLAKPPCIYAVMKDGVVELRNHTYRSKLAYRSSVKSFKKQGFKVYGREG